MTMLSVSLLYEMAMLSVRLVSDWDIVSESRF
jgi:hypothetical protein